MKQELIWSSGFLIVALIAIGRMAAFNFGDIDIQLHDTYYVVPSWAGIVVVLMILAWTRFGKACRQIKQSKPIKTPNKANL